jgi:hypothetical protein
VAVVPIKEARRGDQQLLSTAKRAVAEADLAANANHEVRAVEGYGVAWRRAFQTLTELVSAEATHVPAVALAAAADEALGSKKIALAGPLFPRKVTLLTAASKPELFFGGAEGCPFCAVQRWGMIVALSQFGTFSNLHLMQSDATEPPAVRTFTFFGSSYRSRYVSFVPVEILSNVRQRNRFEHLQRLTAAQRALVNRFDPQGQTPFIDVGGRFIQTDATVRPELLGAESWTEIAGRLTNPSSVSTQAIAGEAEVLTAELCTVTGGAPISVCSSSEVKEYQAGLPLLDGHGGGCPMPHPGGGLPSRTHPPRAGTTRCHI